MAPTKESPRKPKKKSLLIAYLLLVFLGFPLGAHKFYLKKWRPGIGYLTNSLLASLIACAVWLTVDLPDQPTFVTVLILTALVVFATNLFRWLAEFFTLPRQVREVNDGTALPYRPTVAVFIFAMFLFAANQYAILRFWTAAKKPYEPTDFLQDAVLPETLTPAKLADVPYAEKDGTTFTVPAAAGEVIVLADPKTDPRRQIILAKLLGSDDLLLALPSAGFYLFRVPVGKEGKFISKIDRLAFVNRSFPNLGLEIEMAIQGDTWNAKPNGETHATTGEPLYDRMPAATGGKFRLTTDPKDAAAHGDKVFYLMNGKTWTKEAMTACRTEKRCLSFDEGWSFPAALDRNRHEPGLVFNLSWGPVPTDANRQLLPQETILQDYRNWLRQYLSVLDLPPELAPGANKAFVVKSAGNSGTDLTAALSDPSLTDRPGWQRMFFVGALDENGDIASYSNWSRNPGDIIYVPVKERTASEVVGGADRRLTQGTSFAAPQITYLINRLIEEYPELAADPSLLRKVMFDPSVVKTKKVTRDGVELSVNVIEDPYSDRTYRNAIAVAAKLSGRMVTPEPRPKAAPAPAKKPATSQPPSGQTPTATQPPTAPTAQPEPTQPTGGSGNDRSSARTSPFEGTWSGTYRENGTRLYERDAQGNFLTHDYSIAFNLSFAVKCSSVYDGNDLLNVTWAGVSHPYYGCGSCTPSGHLMENGGGDLSLLISFPNGRNFSMRLVGDSNSLRSSGDLYILGLPFYDFECPNQGWPKCTDAYIGGPATPSSPPQLNITRQ